MQKTLLVVALVLGLGACDGLGPMMVEPAEVPASEPAPTEQPSEAPAYATLPDCSPEQVYAVGACGTYQDGSLSRTCSANCTRIDNGESLASPGCKAHGRNHPVHSAAENTAAPWSNNPPDAVTGPVLCVQSTEACSRLCK